MFPNFTISPPQPPFIILTFPTPHILLITINRLTAMNSIPYSMHWGLSSIWDWYDSEPALRVAIITGAGNKSFCAGQDLIELGERQKDDDPRKYVYPKGGFAGVSRRGGKKPIIAAVNGYALGGGFEMVLNWSVVLLFAQNEDSHLTNYSDIAIASPTATFALPEATRGIYAGAGGLPRLMHLVGPLIASEIAMTGRRLSVQEVLRYNLINKISETPESCVEEAIEMARKIADVSPDAIIVTRAALREAWETGCVERAVERVDARYRGALYEGENSREGLRAFREKRAPRWVGSRL
jgi:enoyl-CoA hydratase/carnithine racemase